MGLKKSIFSEGLCFGLSIATTDFESAVHTVLANCETLKHEFITFINVHTLILSKDHPSYRKVQEAASVRFADGYPISMYQKKKSGGKGQSNVGIERIAGPDFMDEVLRASADKGYRHFFYGSDEKTLLRLEERVKNNYPGIQIAGCLAAPYVKSIKKSEFHDMFSKDIKMINDAKADFVWIGLGAPKQEIFMYLAKGEVDGLMLGVGAAFDFLAETKKRAPEWMQKIGMEWVCRLLQEPKRLGLRYLRTNIRFLMMCLYESLKR